MYCTSISASAITKINVHLHASYAKNVTCLDRLVFLAILNIQNFGIFQQSEGSLIILKKNL